VPGTEAIVEASKKSKAYALGKTLGKRAKMVTKKKAAPTKIIMSWQARIDEQRQLKIARTQERDSHVRIGWEVQELTSSFLSFLFICS
jgi:hypothetical protein